MIQSLHTEFWNTIEIMSEHKYLWGSVLPLTGKNDDMIMLGKIKGLQWDYERGEITFFQGTILVCGHVRIYFAALYEGIQLSHE
jgi:hypothetical protein